METHFLDPSFQIKKSQKEYVREYIRKNMYKKCYLNKIKFFKKREIYKKKIRSTLQQQIIKHLKGRFYVPNKMIYFHLRKHFKLMELLSYGLKDPRNFYSNAETFSLTRMRDDYLVCLIPIRNHYENRKKYMRRCQKKRNLTFTYS